MEQEVILVGIDWVVKVAVICQNAGWKEEAEKKEGFVASAEKSFQTMHEEG